jgi:hypothetical protein
VAGVIASIEISQQNMQHTFAHMNIIIEFIAAPSEERKSFNSFIQRFE